MYRKRIEVLKGPSAPMPPDNRLLRAQVKATFDKEAAERGQTQGQRQGAGDWTLCQDHARPNAPSTSTPDNGGL